MQYPLRLTPFLLFLILLLSCRKDVFTTDATARLTLGIDTVHFDTVFTTTGSATQSFKIFNNNKEGLKISNIRLAGGAASPFKININGQPGPQVNDLELHGGDSAYVFVSVHINPSAANLPFIISDSVLMDYNGNMAKVQLQAYGQNSHFRNRSIISSNETWTADLPYVITGGLLVQNGTQLTIEKGCRIYMHADAPFIIDGTLKVTGEKEEKENVIFAADRLDAPYRHYPAGWPGIIFTPNSKGNSIQYTQIKNAYQALVLQEPTHTSAPVLLLGETVIDNAYDAGIIAVGSSLQAQNVLVSNCGKNLVIAKGGTYNLTHCTIASYSNSYISHKDPLVQVSNAATQNNTVTLKNLSAIFRNCIIWGESSGLVKNEILLLPNAAALFSVTFDGVLWNSAVQDATVTGNSITENPQFRSTTDKLYDFRLTETSPALNKGVSTFVTLDLLGKPRPVGVPDLGAYEQQ